MLQTKETKREQDNFKYLQDNQEKSQYCFNWPQEQVPTDEKYRKADFWVNNTFSYWPQKSINTKSERRRDLHKVGKINLKELGILNEHSKNVQELL